MVELSQSRIVIASRFRTSVPLTNLVDFLAPRVRELIVIKHPFVFNPEIGSTGARYESGHRVQEEVISYKPGISEIGLYTRTCRATMRWVHQFGRADLFIGIGALEAFIGVVLKKLGRVDAVAFYSIDVVTERFKNPFVNRVYRFVEQMVVKQADVVWNLSEAMIDVRHGFYGTGEIERAKTVVVPIGTDHRATQYSFEEINPLQIVYMGHLRKGQGVDFLLRVMKQVVGRVPDATLLLIGSGEEEHALRALAKELGLSEQVTFTGFVADQSHAEDLVARSVVAIAPYDDAPDNFTRFTDPGKIKTYLAAGVPVVMTDIVPIARIIHDRKCGYAVPFDEGAVVEQLVTFLSDTELLRSYKANVADLSAEYHWDTILARAVEKTRVIIGKE